MPGAEPTIRFALDDWSRSMGLTMSEARQIAHTLLALCEDALGA
jgi:hypothetical protein